VLYGRVVAFERYRDPDVFTPVGLAACESVDVQAHQPDQVNHPEEGAWFVLD
jgi:hypothetical protein